MSLRKRRKAAYYTVSIIASGDIKCCHISVPKHPNVSLGGFSTLTTAVKIFFALFLLNLTMFSQLCMLLGIEWKNNRE
jgi:hypothetical protein